MCLAFRHNWDMFSFQDELSKYQLPDGSSDKPSVKQKLPIAVVDSLADELVAEYANPGWRKWYCGVIKDFGPAQVHEWRRRASEGKEPGKLFSKYASEARTYKRGKYEDS